MRRRSPVRLEQSAVRVGGGRPAPEELQEARFQSLSVAVHADRPAAQHRPRASYAPASSARKLLEPPVQAGQRHSLSERRLHRPFQYVVGDHGTEVDDCAGERRDWNSIDEVEVDGCQGPVRARCGGDTTMWRRYDEDLGTDNRWFGSHRVPVPQRGGRRCEAASPAPATRHAACISGPTADRSVVR